MIRSFYKNTFLVFILSLSSFLLKAHQVDFCGEEIPLSDDFVTNKLMNVIRKQMPTANLPYLKQRASKWFPYIEACLKKYGLPEDFKYLPIVESGFSNATSKTGAYGFWQLMPETAKEHNLIVNSFLDERDDPYKATIVACQLIRNYYKIIKNKSSNPSWVLTAAAYNFGIGNILKAVHSQGENYFRMDLNAETSEYVYKLIAIKELFENPEIYMKGFGRNVFANNEIVKEENTTEAANDNTDIEFKAIVINIEKNPVKKKPKIYFVPAHIVTGKKKFQDGKLVTIELDGDLNLPGGFIRKGNILKGNGWLVDERVFINLGYGHTVQLMDGLAVKGVPQGDINSNGQKILLKVEIS